MSRNLCLVAAFGAWFVATPASAQAPLPLTLEDAITRAVAQAPAVADARAREAAAEATVTSREAAASPSVTATGGYLRTNHVEAFGIPRQDGTIRALFPDLPNNYRARAELDVPIYTSGRTTAAVDAARADRRAAAADAKVAEEDVRLETIRAYWQLVTARERVTVLEADLARMDAWVGDVQARRDAGLLPPNDVLSAQAQRARENVQLIQARQAAAVAEIDLARLLGIDLSQRIAVSTPVDRPIAGAAEAAAQPIDVLVARARETRGERLGLRERQAGLRSAAEAALAAARPQVAGVAAVEPSRPNARFVPRTDEWKTSWDLGVNVVWPLWDGGRARADRAALLAQSSAVGYRIDDFDARVAVDVRQRLLDLDANNAALQAAGEAVAAATEARRVVGERFNAGVATPTDVLDAQNALLQAELERTQILAALRIGEARLLRTIGAL
jgi:outer membrane protein TolC